MLKSQVVFGPHHQDQRNVGAIALGRALYRLLPEDIYDRGPIVGGDGQLTLVADARLDNREELIEALALSRARAKVLCDAAVLMAAVERWEEEALDRLVGDFAFALWDARRKRLLLARDYLGQRPLHYHRGPGFFAFASMAKGLHAIPDVPYAPRTSAMADFLVLVPDSGDETFFEGVKRVPAGHVMSVTPNGTSMRRYWQPQRKELRLGSSENYADALREQMDAAVRSRLRGADGAVAAHLSGGLDSSTVAATAARLFAPQKVVAFTSVPAVQGEVPAGRLGDEGPLAAATAAMHPNIEHVRVCASRDSPLANLDKYFFFYERPLLNLCNTPWVDAINVEASSRGIKVMLVGQMGNFSFSHTGLQLLPRLLREGRFIKLAKLGFSLTRDQMSWRGFAFATTGPFLPSWLRQRLKVGHRSLATNLHDYSSIRPSAVEALGVYGRARNRGLDLSYPPWSDGFAMRRWALARADLGNWNKGTLAGWNIDYRDPTADRRLVEFCLSVPEEQFLIDGMPRSLARRAFADRLPQAVLRERRKGLQSADWHLGLHAAREQIATELNSLSNCPPAAELIDLETLAESVKTFPAAGWAEAKTVGRYRLSLLRGISAGHFLRKASKLN
jgi:asparagine synthase (glutamine-hydrolysing)